MGLDCSLISPYCEKETDKQFSGVDMIPVIKLLANNIKYTKSTTIEHIMYEVGYIGYTNLIDKQQDDNIYVISTIETNKYGTPFATLYQCNSGNTETYKINRKWYSENELQIGDIIRASIKDQYKRVKVDNKWVEDKEQIESILSSYFIMKRIEN